MQRGSLTAAAAGGSCTEPPFRDLLVPSLPTLLGNGHHYGGAWLVDDGLVLDLSHMKAIHVDPVTRTAVVQPGVTTAELREATIMHGLHFPGGHISSVGISGLILGGLLVAFDCGLCMYCDTYCKCPAVCTPMPTTSQAWAFWASVSSVYQAIYPRSMKFHEDFWACCWLGGAGG